MADKGQMIRELAREERFDEALRLIREAEAKGPLCPNLLVLKGICIELAESGQYSPSDAKEAFMAALAIDDEYVEALNELGHFYLSAKESPQDARPLFERALDVCEDQMTESVLGLAQCLLETTGKEAALKFLRDVQHAPMDMDRIKELEREIKSAGKR